MYQESCGIIGYCIAVTYSLAYFQVSASVSITLGTFFCWYDRIRYWIDGGDEILNKMRDKIKTIDQWSRSMIKKFSSNLAIWSPITDTQ